MMKVTIVLTGTVDWDTWYTIIKMVAKGKEIWDYINPEMSQELCPILVKPEEPAFSELHANAALYIDLNTTECKVYKFMYQKYKTNYDEYKVLHTAIEMYSAEIIKSVSLSIISYICNCKGTYNVLVELWTQFAFTDKT